MGMALNVQRVVNMDPQAVIKAGSNDHLQTRGLLNGLVDGSSASSEVIEGAIKTLLCTMMEAEKSIQRCFAMKLVKVVFILFPGNALLPEPLQFLYAMVILLAEGRFDVVIPTPKRQVDPNS